MAGSSPKRRRALVAGLAIAAASILVWTFIAREGEIRDGGRIYRFPLPGGAVRLSEGLGSATYLSVGNPKLAALFSERAERCGWTYREQMGSGYLLTSPDRTLTVTTSKRTTAFTTIRFDVITTR